MRHVVVVGGGIAGLVATRDLLDAGMSVTLVEGAPRLGGLIDTVEAWGRPVDLGAESLFLAAPGLRALLEDLDLGAETVAAARRPTWLARGGRLRPLPEGVGPGGPSRLGPVLRSGVLSPVGLVRAGLDAVVPGRPDADVSVGAFVRRRFGREVADRLVAPLLGNLHAGPIDGLSLEAALPMVHRTATRHRSLLVGAYRARRNGAGTAGGAVFVSFRGGLRVLVDALAARVGAADVRLGTPVARVEAAAGRYEVVLADGGALDADAVVLAVPAAAAAPLVASVDAEAAGGLQGLRAASVAVAVLAYPATALAAAPALAGTGVLVGPGEQRLLKAATFLSSKWPHLDGAPFLVRASAGRFGESRIAALDDDALVARLHDDLADLTGLEARPVGALVRRWPQAMPQLEVGHAGRLAAVRDALGAHPGVVLAGAGYRGVGLSSAVRGGHDAAADVLRRQVPV